jgi:hypothetical protein
MPNPNWQASDAIAETVRLIQSDVLGFYTHVEVTEIFGVPNGEEPLNVFTLLVAEERLDPISEEAVLLNADGRIKLPSLRNWNFGIKRYYRPVSSVVPVFSELADGKGWSFSSLPLVFGNLTPIPTQFVPPDSGFEVPWNRVLKNNFWNGSHVIEWADLQKTTLRPLFENPPRLHELSEAVSKYVPMGLASFSDRLGNIAIQLPVTVVLATFTQVRATQTFNVNIAWHPSATLRPLRAACEMEFDKIVSGYSSADVQGAQTPLSMPPGQGLHQGFLWDDQHAVILAATGESSFIHTIAMNLCPVDSEPRVFTMPGEDGNEDEVRVTVMAQPMKSIVGKTDDYMEWTRGRMYREEIARLKAERRFVQYKPKPGRQSEEHKEALGHIRELLNRHGQKGAWLWDPYLSAMDVLRTLFHCSHANSDLRALSAGDEFTSGNPPGPETPFSGAPPANPSLAFAQKQRTVLENIRSNFRGLKLEYRIKSGSAGWAFHDRFLIFPQAEGGALAWSLGTSLNSLGKQHHILQRVDDGQLIMDAFEELWNLLTQPEHLIWKTPR